MHAIADAARMFSGVSYNQITTEDLLPLLVAKIKAVTAKIAERHTRVAKIMKDNKITDAALADMLVQYMKDQSEAAHKRQQTYSIGNAPVRSGPGGRGIALSIPAGVVSNLVTEKEYIESEGEELNKLNLVRRNLRTSVHAFHPQTGATISRLAIHTLSDAELEYLGR